MSVTVFKIPLDGIQQSFEINLANVDYNFIVKYNPSNDAGWIIDILDSNQINIVGNIPMITGADCLAGLEYLGINGSLWVLTDQDVTAVPTFTNLGKDCNLYFQTDVISG